MYPSLLAPATVLAAAAEPASGMAELNSGQSDRGWVAERSSTWPGVLRVTGEFTNAAHSAGCWLMQYSWSTKLVPARSERVTTWTME